MLHFKRYLILVSLSILSISSYGQLKKTEIKKLIYKGDNLISVGNFSSAKESFAILLNNYPENELYQYGMAICNTQSAKNKKEALASLQKLELSKNKKDLKDINYYLAIGYYQNFNFEKSKECFEKYYSQIDSIDNVNLKTHVQLLMSYNNNALEICKDTLGSIKITNLNTPLNSDFHEYSPYVNPSEDVMVLTYMGPNSLGGKMNQSLKTDLNFGKYYEDVLISYRDTNNLWTKPKGLEGINTKSNEASAGISINGEHLFIFKSTSENQGDIFESFIDEKGKWSTPTVVKGINTNFWEGSAALSVSGNTIYFSSDRLGGYGGKDLYSAKLQANNTWGEVKNLGPKINTFYDEDAPYIHPDNKTLYFSSNGSNSIGGYDIFYADLQDNGIFNNITNVGVPINTLENDRFYILSADGQTGYLSKESGRDTKDQDIYLITPGKVGSRPLLALINGKVFLNNLKGNATIKVRDLKTSEIQGIYKTNPNSDIFTMLLNPGKHYLIDVEVNGKTMYQDTLNSDFIDQFIQLTHDYHVYSEDFKGDKPIIQISLQEKMQQVYNETTEYTGIDTNFVLKHSVITTRKDTLKLHDLNSIVKQNRINFYKSHQDIATIENVSKELLKLAENTELTDAVEFKRENGYKPEYHTDSGDILKTKSFNDTLSLKEKAQLNKLFHPIFKPTDLVYRVQVAAYRKPNNYFWKGSKFYGDALEATYPDGITRFTIGGTMHLQEAEELRIKLINFGIEDAFIVSFKGSERVPLFKK